tara:strand:+ start:172 stop:525 length:354 start_codon:yes stop_codon:yes gene_type:complete
VTKRRSLSRAEREAIAERDDWVCGICRDPIGKYEAWEIDHHHALGRGGAHDDENFRAVHFDCHKAKTKDDVKEIAKTNRLVEKWAGRRQSKKEQRLAAMEANRPQPVAERQTTEVDR